MEMHDYCTYAIPSLDLLWENTCSQFPAAGRVAVVFRSKKGIISLYFTPESY